MERSNESTREEVDKPGTEKNTVETDVYQKRKVRKVIEWKNEENEEDVGESDSSMEQCPRCDHRCRMMDKLMTRVKAIDYQIMDLQDERSDLMRSYRDYEKMACCGDSED